MTLEVRDIRTGDLSASHHVTTPEDWKSGYGDALLLPAVSHGLSRDEADSLLRAGITLYSRNRSYSIPEARK